MIDLDTQEQPGDREEQALRLDRAATLAAYLIKHPGPVGSVRYRIENLDGCQASEHELDLLVELVEHLIDLHTYQQRSTRDGS